MFAKVLTCSPPRFVGDALNGIVNISSSRSSPTRTIIRTTATRTTRNVSTATTTTIGRKLQRPRVVILGSGWGGNTLARRLNKDIYDVRLISPVNHFLFTPLLPSTAVGTLEFRAIQEPVRTIPGLGEYYQAKARTIDIQNRTVICEDLFKKQVFDVKYDYLCIATGNKTNTFHTPGISSHEGKEVFFLKHLLHARQIRNRILECFERASNTNITKEERRRLLSFIVVGGGPTSCEFTTELYDFLKQDVSKWYPDLMKDIQITLVEAGPGLLGSFHKSLADYYLQKLIQKKIDVRLSTAVTGVEDRFFEENAAAAVYPTTNNGDGSTLDMNSARHYTVAKFADGTELPFGMMVWSAGLAPVKFIENNSTTKEGGNPLFHLERGRIIVDKYLRVPGYKGRIMSLGDCATVQQHVDENGIATSFLPLPPTASVAEQQAYYLSDCLNNYNSKYDILNRREDEEVPLPGPVTPALMPWSNLEFLNKLLCKSETYFQYKNRGAMAAMGFGGGVSDFSKSDFLPNLSTTKGNATTTIQPAIKVTTSGFAAFFMWRSAYWTKQLSFTNMILIPMYWFKQMIFGRDISRF